SIVWARRSDLAFARCDSILLSRRMKQPFVSGSGLGLTSSVPCHALFGIRKKDMSMFTSCFALFCSRFAVRSVAPDTISLQLRRPHDDIQQPSETSIAKHLISFRTQ